MKIHFSSLLFRSCELLNERDQVEKRARIKPLRGQTERFVSRWIGPIGPLACNAECAAAGVAESKRVDACNAANPQDREALASKWVERMADFSPSQMRTVLKCSPR